MARILVTEEIADGGLDRLRAAGHDVDVQTGLSADDLLTAVQGVHALIIRSATTVTDECSPRDRLARRRSDRDRAGQRRHRSRYRSWVMVINAPQSNIVSAAEHTMALLLAQARNVP